MSNARPSLTCGARRGRADRAEDTERRHLLAVAPVRQPARPPQGRELVLLAEQVELRRQHEAGRVALRLVLDGQAVVVAVGRGAPALVVVAGRGVEEDATPLRRRRRRAAPRAARQARLVLPRWALLEPGLQLRERHRRDLIVRRVHRYHGDDHKSCLLVLPIIIGLPALLSLPQPSSPNKALLLPQLARVRPTARVWSALREVGASPVA